MTSDTSGHLHTGTTAYRETREQQRFTMQSGLLTSTSGRQRSAISGWQLVHTKVKVETFTLYVCLRGNRNSSALQRKVVLVDALDS